MTDQLPTEEKPSPDTKRRGIFLSSMIWTEDRQAVEQEKQRLLAFQQQLATFVSTAQASDDCSSWYMMADAALSQLNRDIDNLFEWLEATKRRVGGSGAITHGF